MSIAPSPPPPPSAPVPVPVPQPTTPEPDNASQAGEEDPGAALEELGAAGLLRTPAGSSVAESPATPAPVAPAAPTTKKRAGA